MCPEKHRRKMSGERAQTIIREIGCPDCGADIAQWCMAMSPQEYRFVAGRLALHEARRVAWREMREALKR